MLAIGLAAIETRLVEVYGLLAYPVRPNVTIAWPSGEAPGEHNEVIPRFPPVVQTIHRRRADRLVFAEVTAAPLPGGLPGLLGKPQFLEIPGDLFGRGGVMGVFPDDSVGDGANVYEVVSGRDLEDALGIGHDDLEKSAMRAKEMGVISDFRIESSGGQETPTALGPVAQAAGHPGTRGHEGRENRDPEPHRGGYCRSNVGWRRFL